MNQRVAGLFFCYVSASTRKYCRVDGALLTDHSWQHAIFHVDDPTSRFHTPLNKGREAMAYLTYIIDTYQDLPKMVTFIHPHRTGWPAAWHNDVPGYDAVTMLTTLREEFVLDIWQLAG